MSKGPYYKQRFIIKTEVISNPYPLVDIVTYKDFNTFAIDKEKSMIPYSYVVLPHPKEKK